MKSFPLLFKLFPYLVIILFIVCQVPFLEADADLNLSHSRGAWTDEGLYTLQLRNWLNHGIWSIEEVDAFVRAPLFNALLLPSFLLFGTQWITARLTILLLTSLTFFLIARKSLLQQTTPLLLLCLCFCPVIFHYSHLAMTEIPATCFLLMALLFFHQSLQTKKLKYAILAHVFVLITVFIKISFVYAAGILPACLGVLIWISNKEERGFLRRQLLISLANAALISALFYFVWYLPNQVYLTKIFAIQSELQFDNNLHDLWERVKFTHLLYRSDPYIGYSVYLFYINVLLTALWFISNRKHKADLVQAGLVIFCCVWLGIELLKFINMYLPSRYLISTVTVNMLLFFVLLHDLRAKQNLHMSVPMAVLVLAGIGFSHIARSFTHRSYQIKEANAYFEKTIHNKKQPALGNWASVCCWNSKVYSRYCVKDYANQQALLTQPKPRLILAEPDEGESAGALQAVGYDCKAHADSVKIFTIANWQINAYWISH